MSDPVAIALSHPFNRVLGSFLDTGTPATRWLGSPEVRGWCDERRAERLAGYPGETDANVEAEAAAWERENRL